MLGEQFSLFDPGPARDTTDYYHYSRRDRHVSPLFRDPGQDTWKPDAPATHAGTRRAALERGNVIARGDRGGVVQPTTGSLHVVRPKSGAMLNTPETRVSDTLANKATSDGQGQPGVIEPPSPGDEMFSQHDVTDAWLDGKGAFYRNAVEDAGSTSLVAPSAALERRMSFDVVGPTVAREYHGHVDHEYPHRVYEGKRTDQYGFEHNSYGSMGRQFRLFDVAPGLEKSRAHALGEPRFERYA